MKFKAPVREREREKLNKKGVNAALKWLGREMKT